MATLPAAYFEYPFRRPGMDHTRYAYSNLFERKPVTWPNGADLAPEFLHERALLAGQQTADKEI